MENFIDIALWLAMGMVALAILAAVVLPLINSLSNPKVLVKGAIGVVAIVVLFLVAWGASSNEVTNAYIDANVDASTSQLVGGSLLTMYILFIISVIGVIFSEINKAIK